MGHHDAESQLGELLDEARWLRGIARALVGPDAAADLAQDVHLAAARGAAPAEWGPRRAWLRIAAKRIAIRRAGRESKRRWVEAEAGAARAESSVEPADLATERVALQRRLAEALSRLASEDRALLVRRYFDGATAPEIAAELGLSPAAVRQRLVRATDRLRVAFARTEEEWRAWSPALTAAAYASSRPGALTGAVVFQHADVGRSASRVTRALARTEAAVGALLPLLPIIAMKKLALTAAAVLALAAATWFLVWSSDGGARGGAESAARIDRVALDAGLNEGGTTALRRVETGDTRSTKWTHNDVRREIIVLDEDQRPIPGIRGVWIDGTTGDVRELHFDADGHVPRPDGSAATIAVVGPAHRLTRVRIRFADAPEAPIILHPAPVIEGRIDVQGTVDHITHNILIEREFDDPAASLGAANPHVVMRVLGSCDVPITTTTDQMGRFRVLCRTRSVGLVVPEYVTVERIEVDGRSQDVPPPFALISVPSDAKQVVIGGVLEPSMTARLVHEGSMEAYAGHVTLAFTDASGEVGYSNGVAGEADGSTRFRLPLTMFGGGPDREWVHLSVSARVSGQQVEVGRVTLDPHAPEADFGTFLVPPLPIVNLHVTRRGVAGAEPAKKVRVQIGTETHRFAGAGPWRLPWPLGQEAIVVADHCRVKRLPPLGAKGGDVRVALDPAPSLIVPPISRSMDERFQLHIQFDPDQPRGREDALPLRGIALLGNGARTGGATSRRMADDRSGHLVYAFSVALPVDRELVVSSLIGKRPATAYIVDVTGHALHSAPIPAGEYAEFVLRPEIQFDALARLTVEIDRESGQAIAPVRLRIERLDSEPSRVSAGGLLVESSSFDVPALAPGEVRVTVVDVETRIESKPVTVDLGPGANRVVVKAPVR